MGRGSMFLPHIDASALKHVTRFAINITLFPSFYLAVARGRGRGRGRGGGRKPREGSDGESSGDEFEKRPQRKSQWSGDILTYSVNGAMTMTSLE